MPDITMCEGTGCARRAQCYRHTATPTPERQSFFGKPPYTEHGLDKWQRCDYFWSNCDWEQVADSDDGARQFKCIHHGEYKSE